jgi:hypothetical protein
MAANNHLCPYTTRTAVEHFMLLPVSEKKWGGVSIAGENVFGVS